MYIRVLVVCCKNHFWSCRSLDKKDPKTFGTKPAMKRIKLFFFYINEENVLECTDKDEGRSVSNSVASIKSLECLGINS